MNDSAVGTTPKELACDEVRELLSDYVDRELTDSERAAVEQHLTTCMKCGTESTRVAGLKKVMQHWDGVKGSGEFRQVVIQKIIRESQQVPAAQFTDAAAKSAPAQDSAPQPEARYIPPAWVLGGAAVLAALVYFIVRALR